MGIFGKKNASNENNAQSSTPRKVKDDLTTVLDESVMQNVIEDLKANKQFIVKDNGTTRYVAFILETEQFGGLSGKNAKKDESKGSIIEAIRTGRIKSYLRADMLENGMLIIIPEYNTIENMDEFNILSNAMYTLCQIDSKGNVETVTENDTDSEDDPEVRVKFDVIHNLIRDKGDVKTLFKKQTGPVFNAGSEDDAESIDDAEPLPETNVQPIKPVEEKPVEPVSVQPSVEPIEQPIAQPVQTPAPAATQPVQTQEPATQASDGSAANSYVSDAESLDDIKIDDSFDDFMSSDSAVQHAETAASVLSNPMDDNMDAEGGYDVYEDITASAIDDYVSHKVYTDDLGLEVSTAPFDSIFVHNNPYVPFNENRGEGWLNNYLSTFSKNANSKLEQMHTANIYHLRERYMRLIQGHCTTIAQKLNTATQETSYGRMKRVIEAGYTKNMNEIDSTIAAKKQQLEEAWKQTLKEVGDRGYATAIEEHKRKYEKAHQEDIQNLRKEEEDEIKSDFNESMNRLNDDRRKEASLLLDMAINETISEMSVRYEKLRKEEDKIRSEYEKQMLQFIDENRKDEIARIEALSEENRQVKRANEIRAEYVNKIKTMVAEFDMKRTVLQADIDRLQKEHESDIAAYTSECNAKVNAEKQRADALQAQLNDLLAQYSTLEDRKNQEFENRLEEYKRSVGANSESMAQSMTQVVEANKKTNKVLAIICAVAAIAGIGIGFIISNTITAHAAEINDTSAIVQTVDDDTAEQIEYDDAE